MTRSVLAAALIVYSLLAKKGMHV
ncbi:hypothetical protein AZE42_13471 [Rhizopogon vesiculosus]|uniref:Uncharacterized protein n=1 Tax=Rhizopogon vesiculosus TaxID=180088 RepID=A0A1J8RIR8_9AGAM|nr:hypothetical protein AZE42_13471 [Rhizopogon vesiculosus]